MKRRDGAQEAPIHLLGSLLPLVSDSSMMAVFGIDVTEKPHR